MTDLKHGAVAYQGSVGEVTPMSAEKICAARRTTADYVARHQLEHESLAELLDMLGLREVRS